MPERVLSLDDIDLRIITFLEKDVETPFYFIAEQLGVSLTTIYNRVRHLKRIGVIKKTITQIDYAKLGYGIRALVGVSVSPKMIEVVVREFRKLPQVHLIYEITGRYDCMLEVLAKNVDELRQLLTVEMGRIEGIQRTETMIITKGE